VHVISACQVVTRCLPSEGLVLKATQVGRLRIFHRLVQPAPIIISAYPTNTISSRVSKRVNRKVEERTLLAESIELSREFADMPCSYYFRHQKACLMSEGSSRCSECVRRGRSCDGTRVATSRAFSYFLGGFYAGFY
jgi:hypothetical protein